VLHTSLWYYHCVLQVSASVETVIEEVQVLRPRMLQGGFVLVFELDEHEGDTKTALRIDPEKTIVVVVDVAHAMLTDGLPPDFETVSNFCIKSPSTMILSQLQYDSAYYKMLRTYCIISSHRLSASERTQTYESSKLVLYVLYPQGHRTPIVCK